MQIYVVGGAVRDVLLGRPIADRDYVVVGATPQAMRAFGFRPVGKDFPVFLHPDSQEEYSSLGLCGTMRQSRRKLTVPRVLELLADLNFCNSMRWVFIILETAVGQGQVCRDAVRWQAERTLRARARKDEQRRQRAAARCNRPCSVRIHTENVFVGNVGCGARD